MSSVYTGQVQGVCVLTGGGGATPTAFCRAVTSGTLTVDFNAIRKVGAGGQLHARKGTSTITLEITCVGIKPADLQLWFPATAGVQVASFPKFRVECVDGRLWDLEDGQPGTVSIDIGDGQDAEMEMTVSATFALATPGTAVAPTAIYNDDLGYTRNEVTFEIGGSPVGALSFSLSNDNGATLHNPMDGKDDGEKTFPDGVVITTQNVSLTLATSEPMLLGDDDGAFQDEFTAADVVIDCDNGTDQMTITCTDMVAQGSVNMPIEAEGIVAFASELAPGDGDLFGRVTLAGGA